MILVPYDAAWPDAFSSLAAVLTAALGESTTRIEHVGSTAIPGLRAKPIVDLDVVLSDPGALAEVAARLLRLGYTHQGDLGIAGREAFRRDDSSVPWTDPRRFWIEHHLYVCAADGPELRRHLKFRDVLRARVDLRNDYEKIKLDVEKRSGSDRKIYAAIKEVACRAFVERVLREPAE